MSFKIEFEVRNFDAGRVENVRLQAELKEEYDKWRKNMEKLKILSKKYSQLLSFVETGTMTVKILTDSVDEKTTFWHFTNLQRYLHLLYNAKKLPYEIKMQRIPGYHAGFRPAAAWTKRIDAAAQLYNWSAKQTYVYASEALSSKPLQWFQANRAHLTTWWELRRGLEGTFDSPLRFYTTDQPQKAENITLLSISDQRHRRERQQQNNEDSKTDKKKRARICF